MEILNIPNFLTLSRFILAPLIGFFFLTERYGMTLVLFFLAGLTDFFDGILARILKSRTPLGAILDPAADKFLMTICFIVLAIRQVIPLWVALLVVSRDLYIVLGLAILKKLKKKLYFQPTRTSKLTTFFQLLTLLTAFAISYPGSREIFSNLGLTPVPIQYFFTSCIYLTVGMTILSGIQYTRIGLMILKDRLAYADIPLKKG